MRYVKAFGAAVLAALIGGGIVLMLPGISDSTAAMVGAAAAVAGWKTVMSRQGGRSDKGRRRFSRVCPG